MFKGCNPFEINRVKARSMKGSRVSYVCKPKFGCISFPAGQVNVYIECISITPQRSIFRQVLNCDTRSRRYLDDEDLMRFMQEEEAIRALALFDGAMESGKITKKALKSWVVRNSCTECGPLGFSIGCFAFKINISFHLWRILRASV